MEISNVRALPYFNVNAETTLQTDASKKGLGACLTQNGKVVCYASRALTKTEQNYQNLEREALGTIWGMEKFHYFLYGKEFTLETDQKPLPFNVIYKKGKDILVADALSQVTPMDPEDNIKLPIIAVNLITAHPVKCTSSGYFFQKVRSTEEEYSTGQSTHKTQLLH